MKIKQIKVLKTKAKFKQLKAIEKLLNSDEIDNNGSIIIHCDIEADLEELRGRISDILEVKKRDVLFTKYIDEPMLHNTSNGIDKSKKSK